MIAKHPFIALGLIAALAPALASAAESGAAVLRVMPNANNVQRSNFGSNSFQVTNTGDKDIVSVEIDVTGALYPDIVFDPEGKAGDSVAKPLRINTPGETGVRNPQEAGAEPYGGDGGAAGYRVLRLFFDADRDGGFNPGESVGFAIDMDPNSIAGTKKAPLDAGSTPRWDVGGVSGAEMIGSTFTVVFADGSRAQGQLHGTNTQAGSHGLAAENAPARPLELRVGEWKPGESGETAEIPPIVVKGPDGQSARVIVTRGFIQPVEPYADFLSEQLAELAQAEFPANNAVDFQTVDIELTGEEQDISDQFDLTPPTGFRLEAAEGKPFAIEPGKLPVGIVGAVIDPETKLPLGAVTAPIYLRQK